MLSILIPCYNFNVYKLVKDIYKQAKVLNIKYEIICIEDGSSKTFNNSKLKDLKNVYYLVNKNNIGRSKIRNLLAEKSKYNWLLFIDCDSEIVNKNYILKYVNNTKKSNIIYYGKTVNPTKYKKNDNSLHWKYGKKVESKRKIKVFSSHHFLIEKKIFNTIHFDNKIEKYGHEDTIFYYQLKQKKYKFKFIDNPLIHAGLEKNKNYIIKTEQSIKNLIELEQRYDLNEIKIVKISKILSYFYINYILIFIFSKLETFLYKNLISKNPSLILFQFYKLGFYCKNLKIFKNSN